MAQHASHSAASAAGKRRRISEDQIDEGIALT
jgi:hypothetical protein